MPDETIAQQYPALPGLAATKGAILPQDLARTLARNLLQHIDGPFSLIGTGDRDQISLELVKIQGTRLIVLDPDHVCTSLYDNIPVPETDNGHFRPAQIPAALHLAVRPVGRPLHDMHKVREGVYVIACEELLDPRSKFDITLIVEPTNALVLRHGYYADCFVFPNNIRPIFWFDERSLLLPPDRDGFTGRKVQTITEFEEAVRRITADLPVTRISVRRAEGSRESAWMGHYAFLVYSGEQLAAKFLLRRRVTEQLIRVSKVLFGFEDLRLDYCDDLYEAYLPPNDKHITPTNLSLRDLLLRFASLGRAE